MSSGDGSVRTPAGSAPTAPGPSATSAADSGSQAPTWKAFLSTLASFRGDLSALTAPSFILSPVSLLEFSAYWGEHPSALVEISQAQDPAERMVRVLRWFIATLRGAYTARNRSAGMEKKPLNPILGELFRGEWPATPNASDPDCDAPLHPEATTSGATQLVAEQVSHHPPISAYHIANVQAGIRLTGHSGQETTFSKGSIRVRQVGHVLLRVRVPWGATAERQTEPEGDEEEEVYLITLPEVAIEGLWYMSPYLELVGDSFIFSSAGYTTKVHYTGMGYFFGTSHGFTADVYGPAESGARGAEVSDAAHILSEPLVSVGGVWDGQSKFTLDKRPGSQAVPKDSVFWDADARAPTRRLITVPAQALEDPRESRTVWKHTAEGIRSRDYVAASRDKTRVEEEERALRKERAARKEKHTNVFFDFAQDATTCAAPLFERAAGLGVRLGGSYTYIGPPAGQQEHLGIPAPPSKTRAI